MFNYSFTRVSGNEKTGPIPVTRTDKRSCPDACPLKKNGCYGETSRSNIWWKKLDTDGLSIEELCNNIKKLPVNQLWRHDEVGDLPGYNDNIDPEQLKLIVLANKRKKGFTYTHYPLNEHNLEQLRYANDNGFTINISFNKLSEIQNYNLPGVVIVDKDAPNKFNYNGHTIMLCPNQINKKITCDRCGLCQKRDRKFIIAFKPHGIMKNKVQAMLDN